MEWNEIDSLLEKYFNGETSLNEEQQLRDYFSTQVPAPHLQQYQSLFGYFDQAKLEECPKQLPIFRTVKPVRNRMLWWSAAASIVVLVGWSTFAFLQTTASEQSDLGTYEDPKVAFEATQKALSMLSTQVNVGIESVQYIEEYQIAKNKVFKKPVTKQQGS
ncbi:hypothetical protein [Flavobacterium turcicum]|uniref:Anti-sigma factor n=1 Tax=Flavobacterium turcicum TaxID=2764718 RepID=A0ABR7JHY3_9FLAO|nr:hypothetical protein [Flavobacterium turcicum]MBC5863920.1 hypothetical protein [Flavobacterium turcicum]NHL02686.1 hypothetical protein [Flavobacterium turcicum]